MLYLIDEFPENVSVKARFNSWTISRILNKALLKGKVLSLLDDTTAEFYGKIFEMNIPSNNFLNVEKYALGKAKALEPFLVLGDQCFCMFTREDYDNSFCNTNAMKKENETRELFLFSGFFDQPLIDVLTYEYCGQVDLENALVRNGHLNHTGYKKDNGKKAILVVTESIKRLLKMGVIEIDENEEKYWAFRPNERQLATYNRRHFRFRLTGKSESGLFLPQEIVVPNISHLQIPLF